MHQIACIYIVVPSIMWNNTYVETIYKLEGGTVFQFKRFNSYNHFHNILRLYDVLPNFLSATSEIMRDYYLQT